MRISPADNEASMEHGGQSEYFSVCSISDVSMLL